jgi:hypothetical protein
MILKSWMIESVAESAFSHGQGYAKSNIYRHVGRYAFKRPEALGLPDWVLGLDLETHKWLADLYRHAFRQGLKTGGVA